MIFVQTCMAIFVMLWCPAGVYAYLLYQREEEDRIKDEELASEDRRIELKMMTRYEQEKAAFEIRIKALAEHCVHLAMKLPEGRSIKARQTIVEARKKQDLGALERIQEALEKTLAQLEKETA